MPLLADVVFVLDGDEPVDFGDLGEVPTIGSDGWIGDEPPDFCDLGGGTIGSDGLIGVEPTDFDFFGSGPSSSSHTTGGLAFFPPPLVSSDRRLRMPFALFSPLGALVFFGALLFPLFGAFVMQVGEDAPSSGALVGAVSVPSEGDLVDGTWVGPEGALVGGHVIGACVGLVWDPEGMRGCPVGFCCVVVVVPG